MTVAIAILGLGRVGGSIGLRLKGRDDVAVTGFDLDDAVAKEAQNLGVVKRAHWNLTAAVQGADLVVVALPLDRQRETYQAIGPMLREGAVVASAAPLLGPPLAWAAEALAASPGAKASEPAGPSHFVAGHAVLSPTRLHGDDAGLSAASADLFEGGLWAMAPAPDCAPEALKLVADLARLLGATPYFADPAEHDGLAAAAEGLPALLALALLQAATASPGWTETRKLTDRAFATATAALVEAEASALRLNRENVTRYLDAALAELTRLREVLASDNAAALSEAVSSAADRRALWLSERRRGEWETPERPANIPTPSDLMGRMLLGRFFKKKEDKDE